MTEIVSQKSVALEGEIVDAEAIEIGEMYQRAKRGSIESVRQLLEIGRRLTDKKAKLGHGNWLPWLKSNEEVLGFGENAALRLMKAISNPELTQDLDESTALQISRKIWGNKENYRTVTTGENEWYTPPEHIEMARKVMGGIDLDPASCEEANEIVQAAHYFTKEDDGLSLDWYGRVWLNPPYSRDLMPAFAAKLRASVESGDVTDAIMVSHNNTDTQWFQGLVSVASAICFPAKRIKFYRDDDVAAPVNGQMFMYFGKRTEDFASVFTEIGCVVTPWTTYQQQ